MLVHTVKSLNDSQTNSRSSKTAPKLLKDDLAYFCALIEARAGIYMKPAKHDLVRARLQSRLEHHNFENFSDYRQFLDSSPKNAEEWEIFTNLLTTNKTDFFREPKHFEFLVTQVLPEWLKTGEKTFKVWSAACSTGEEPYTLAMILSRYLPKDRDFRILGSDIDTDVLQVAQNGVYPVTKWPEVPAEYQQSCLELGKREAAGWFRIRREVKEKVTFRQHNLIEQAAPGQDLFDLVLCRNVLIYFASPKVDFVQKKLHSTVKRGGYFFIGHSESLQGLKHQWSHRGPSVFKKTA